MEHFNIIGQLRSTAHGNGWKFIAGDEFYQNIEAAREEVGIDQLVLTAQFESRPTFVNGRVVEVAYVGAIGLGRKFDDDGGIASLDETYMQKYDARLNELTSLLANFLGDFSCTNELSITDCTFLNQLNNFNTNIDFVIGNITLIQ